jgi:hypothetical protein
LKGLDEMIYFTTEPLSYKFQLISADTLRDAALKWFEEYRINPCSLSKKSFKDNANFFVVIRQINEDVEFVVSLNVLDNKATVVDVMKPSQSLIHKDFRNI